MTHRDTDTTVGAGAGAVAGAVLIGGSGSARWVAPLSAQSSATR